MDGSSLPGWLLTIHPIHVPAQRTCGKVCQCTRHERFIQSWHQPALQLSNMIDAWCDDIRIAGACNAGLCMFGMHGLLGWATLSMHMCCTDGYPTVGVRPKPGSLRRTWTGKSCCSSLSCRAERAALTWLRNAAPFTWWHECTPTLSVAPFV